MRNIKQRLYNDLRKNLAVDINIKIRVADDPVQDAWHGARCFTNDDVQLKNFMTIEEYNEYGAEYYKENLCSNSSPNHLVKTDRLKLSKHN